MFIVLEIQQTTEASVPNTITYTAETLDEAKSKYHYVLSYCATSELRRHGAIIMQTDGRYVDRECFEHEPKVEDEE